MELHELNPNVKIKRLIDNVENVIVGKRGTIELVVAAMLAGGHVLIEDVPGVGKTQLVSAIYRQALHSFQQSLVSLYQISKQ